MDVSLRPFSLDLLRPLETAAGTIEEREGFLIRIADDGVEGVGEATPLPGWTESLLACEDALARVEEAISADGESAALASLEDAPAARHGLSLAVADLAARRNDVPLCRHLGGESTVESVPVNATVGDAPADETAAKAQSAVEEGFEAVKVKVGARSISGDAERLRTVRDAVGHDVELRADANGAWDREQARRALESFAEIDVSFVEQPLSSSDLDGHAALRGGPVGIAVDESLASSSVEEVLAAGAADVLVCKPMVLGGIDRAHDAAIRARESGVTPVLTTTIDGVVARTAAVHLAASLSELPPCGLATATMLADDLAPDPAPVTNGQIRVPRGEGTGVEEAWRER